MSSLIVTVCKVEEVAAHPNADRLDIVRVKDWYSIVGRDQYRVGNLVVFVPPDCVLPMDLIEKYKLEYLKKNGRTGTVKLRGAVSQGLVLDCPSGCKEGDDVSSLLGITKYEAEEAPIRGQAKPVSKKKLNPFFDKYTDIENVNNYKDIFKPGDAVVITEKLHGCNARYANLPIVISKDQPILERIRLWWKKNVLKHTHEFVYGSHNVQLWGTKKNYYGDDVWGRIAKKYNLAEVLEANMIVYGEIYGPGIQDLTYGLKDIDFAVFDIKVIAEDYSIYMNWQGVLNFCGEVGLPTVPEIVEGAFSKDLLKSCTDGPSLICPSQMREGCVVKTIYEDNHPLIGRKILKSVSTEYLTRKGGTEYK
jgi:RNA ligase (TIGR02306 family)